MFTDIVSFDPTSREVENAAGWSELLGTFMRCCGRELTAVPGPRGAYRR